MVTAARISAIVPAIAALPAGSPVARFGPAHRHAVQGIGARMEDYSISSSRNWLLQLSRAKRRQR